MNLKDITLPAFLWYILPGINFLILFVLVPAAILKPKALASNLDASSSIILTVAALGLGFLMDGLKFYQFTPGYEKKKESFRRELAEVFGSEDQNVGKKAFTALRIVVTSQEGGLFPVWEHSRWVMINHTSKLALVAAALWGFLAVRYWQTELSPLSLLELSAGETKVMLAALPLLHLLLGLRLHLNAEAVRKEADSIYLQLARHHREAVYKKLR